MKCLNLIERIKSANLAKFAILGIAAVGLSSCLKNKGPEYVAPDAAGLSVFNALPTTEGVDFVTSSQGLIYGPLNYSFRLNYYSEYASAPITLAFYKTGRTTSADTIRTMRTTLAKDTYHSLFLIGTPNAPEVMLVKDTLTAPANGRVNIRFVNLSPDAGSLTLRAREASGTQDTVLYSNYAFKKISKFTDLPAKTYKLELVEGNDVKGTLESHTFTTGKTYTIWAKGLESSANNDLKVSIKVNENR
ncbi:DUF4397 domain-containing protein [Pseudoxanthomonas sp. SGD-10]|nr:DUF4397 domain-containing protein [Pseudoxanthomonas sp. SGD-10]